MPIPAMYHRAYSLAVAEWQTQQLGGHPSDLQLAALRHFVGVHIYAEYPKVPRTQVSAAIDYGVTSAARDLTSPEVGGFVGQVGGVVDAVVGTVEAEGSAVISGSRSALGALERTVRGVLAQILHAVQLPRAALPAKVPTDLTQAYSTLGREAGSTTPTRLAHSAQTRIRMRRLGR